MKTLCLLLILSAQALPQKSEPWNKSYITIDPGTIVDTPKPITKRVDCDGAVSDRNRSQCLEKI